MLIISYNCKDTTYLGLWTSILHVKVKEKEDTFNVTQFYYSSHFCKYSVIFLLWLVNREKKKGERNGVKSICNSQRKKIQQYNCKKDNVHTDKQIDVNDQFRLVLIIDIFLFSSIEDITKKGRTIFVASIFKESHNTTT